MADGIQTNTEFDPFASQYDPLDGVDSEASFNPADPMEQTVESEHVKNIVAPVQAVIDSEDKVTSLEDEYHRNVNYQRDIMMMELEKVNTKTRKDQLARNIQNSLGASPEALEQSVLDYKNDTEVDNALKEQGFAFLAPYLSQVHALNPHYSKEEALAEAQNLFAMDKTNEVLGEDGFLKKVMDWSTVLLIPGASKDVADVLGVSWIDSTEAWSKFVMAYQQMSPEEKAVYYNSIVDSIKEGTDDNKVQAAIFLQSLIDPDIDQTELDLTLDKIDAAGTVAGLTLGVVGRTLRAAKLVSFIHKTAGAKVAARTAEAVIKSSKMAEATGIDKVDAASSLDVWTQVKSLFPDHTAGLAKEHIAEMEAIDELAVAGDRLALKESFKLEGPDVTAVLDANKARFEKEFNAYDFKVDKVEGQFANISFKYKDKGVETEVNKRLDFTIDDLNGTLSQTTLGVRTGAEKVASPSFLFHESREELVDVFFRIIGQQEIYRKNFGEAFKRVHAGLNNKSINKIDKVLMHGDKYGKVYDYNTLTKTGIEGEKLSHAEALGYLKSRRLLDWSFAMKNREERNLMQLRGMKLLKSSEDAHDFIRPYDTVDSAMAKEKGKFKQGYVKGKGTLVDLADRKAVQKMYDDGYVMVTKDGVFELDTKAKAKFMFVPKDEVLELPARVMNYRTGYTPRFRDTGHYWVKETVSDNVIGATDKVVIGEKSHAYAATRQEAAAWALKKNMAALRLRHGTDEAAILKDLRDGNVPFKVKHDREMLEAELNADSIAMSGGMFTGSRTSRELINLSTGQDELIPALDSMGRYLNHLATRIPLNEYRLGIEKKWLNTAKALGGVDRDFFGSFSAARRNLEKNMDKLTPGQQAFLRSSFEQINYQLRTPTLGEKALMTRTRAVAEWMETKEMFTTKAGKRAMRAVHRLDHANPIDALRSATHHAFLGFFNMGQYMIQASGATIAFSLEPQLAHRVLPNVFKFQVLDNVQDAAARASIMKKLDVSPDEYQAWQRTGLLESVITSNADLHTMYKGFPTDKAGVDRMLDKGMFFYKAGELFNRRYSYLTSMEKFKAKNKRLPTSDEELKSVLNDANHFMLNMSRANKAAWQKGAMSVPTQFLQVHTKFMEALVGPQFKGKRTQLALMQMGLFGAMGVPFGEYVFENVGAFFGLGPDDMSPTTKTYLREGVAWGTMKNFLGIEVEGANRQSIAKGIEDLFKGLVSGEAGAFDVLLGASGGLLDRSWKQLGEFSRVFSSSELDTDNLSAGDYGAAVDSLLDIISSWNNASQAYEIMTNPLFRDKKTGELKFLDDPNLQTKIFMAIGFKSSEIEAMYESSINDKEYKEYIKDKSSKIISNIVRRFGDEDPQSMTEERKLQYDIAIQSMLDLDDPRSIEIRQRVVDALTNPTSKEEKALKQILNRSINNIFMPSDTITQAHLITEEK